MNSESFHALIVDQHFGELSPEVAELLENHLAQNAAARAEADRIKSTLAITEKAVLRYPELLGTGLADTRETEGRLAKDRFGASWLAKAASIALLAALTSTGGFLLGKKQDSAPAVKLAAADAAQRPPRQDSPWARYRVAPERGGSGMQVVRVDAAKVDHSILR